MHARVATIPVTTHGICPANLVPAAPVDGGVNAAAVALHFPWPARTRLGGGDAGAIRACALTGAARVHDNAGAVGTLLEARAATPGGNAGAVGAPLLARAARTRGDATTVGAPPLIGAADILGDAGAIGTRPL